MCTFSYPMRCIICSKFKPDFPWCKTNLISKALLISFSEICDENVCFYLFDLFADRITSQSTDSDSEINELCQNPRK